MLDEELAEIAHQMSDAEENLASDLQRTGGDAGEEQKRRGGEPQHRPEAFPAAVDARGNDRAERRERERRHSAERIADEE